MSIFSKIWAGLKWVGKLFTSKAAKDALNLVDSLVPMVLPTVTSINKIVPSVGDATISDIVDAYQSFGVSAANIKSDPKEFGSQLAQLALTVTRDQLKDTSTPERVIKAAIELALVLIKAK